MFNYYVLITTIFSALAWRYEETGEIPGKLIQYVINSIEDPSLISVKFLVWHVIPCIYYCLLFFFHNE